MCVRVENGLGLAITFQKISSHLNMSKEENLPSESSVSRRTRRKILIFNSVTERLSVTKNGLHADRIDPAFLKHLLEEKPRKIGSDSAYVSKAHPLIVATTNSPALGLRFLYY